MLSYGSRSAGMNRLNLPKAVDPYTGQHNATTFGPACPQQNSASGSSGKTLPGIPPVLEPVLGLVDVINETSEDRKCSRPSEMTLLSPPEGLSINVYKPAWTNRRDKLPVVAVCYHLRYMCL